MAVEIYIARHGQNEDNIAGILNGHRDFPLTDLGRSQAVQLAEAIKRSNIFFDSILCSPLSRAHETAQIVSDAIGGPKPEDLPDLIERDFGIMTGKNVADIEKICAPNIIKTKTITYFVNPDGAETFPQLIERGSRVLDYVKQHHSTGKILLVTHGDIGKMIYVAATGKDWQSVLTDFHFGNAELITTNPDSDAHVIEQKQYNN